MKRRLKISLIIFFINSFAPLWPTMLCGSWECRPGFGPFWYGFLSMPNKEFYPETFLAWLILSIIIFALAYLIAFIYTKIKK